MSTHYAQDAHQRWWDAVNIMSEQPDLACASQALDSVFTGITEKEHSSSYEWQIVCVFNTTDDSALHSCSCAMCVLTNVRQKLWSPNRFYTYCDRMNAGPGYRQHLHNSIHTEVGGRANYILMETATTKSSEWIITGLVWKTPYRACSSQALASCRMATGGLSWRSPARQNYHLIVTCQARKMGF